MAPAPSHLENKTDERMNKFIRLACLKVFSLICNSTMIDQRSFKVADLCLYAFSRLSFADNRVLLVFSLFPRLTVAARSLRCALLNSDERTGSSYVVLKCAVYYLIT